MVFPVHFTHVVRNHREAALYDNRICMRRRLPIAIPSPATAPLDFLRGHFKRLIYKVLVETEEVVLARILVRCEAIQNEPWLFERARQKTVRRYSSGHEIGSRLEQV
jgi:hypothetical protein